MSSDNARGKPVKSYDTLDVAVALLKRREGIDKTLKLVRYASIFAASEAKDAFGADSPFVASATALEKSIGNARRALRLGKFLGNVQDLRDELRDAQSRGVSVLKRWTSAAAACALLEGAYYFLEQGVWLSKAGVAMREKTTLDRLVRWSARAEVMSYVFSVSLSLDEARACVVARSRATSERRCDGWRRCEAREMRRGARMECESCTRSSSASRSVASGDRARSQWGDDGFCRCIAFECGLYVYDGLMMTRCVVTRRRLGGRRRRRRRYRKV